jgi:hypothetical protein
MLEHKKVLIYLHPDQDKFVCSHLWTKVIRNTEKNIRYTVFIGPEPDRAESVNEMRLATRSTSHAVSRLTPCTANIRNVMRTFNFNISSVIH